MLAKLFDLRGKSQGRKRCVRLIERFNKRFDKVDGRLWPSRMVALLHRFHYLKRCEERWNGSGNDLAKVFDILSHKTDSASLNRYDTQAEGKKRLRRRNVKDWIIFEDEHLLVMNKPAGLFTTPGRFEKRCLLNEARALRAEAQAVHRLDLDTSGLVVFGCSKRGISGLNQLFRERRIDKQYVAQVAGTAAVDAGEITFPLGPDRLRRPRQRVNWRTGKQALTRYRVLSASGSQTRLALMPVTGVRHQLRLHLALIGLPIVGCDLYAPASVRASGARLMLHAQRLTFAHPATNRVLMLEAAPDF